ncbi:MAG: PIN domain-containing protein [Solirubrobacteraceae bacterium]
MTLILDAAPVVAIADTSEPLRDRILELMRANAGALVIPAPVTAEIDYLLGSRFGRSARSAFLRDLATGRFAVAGLERQDYRAVGELEQRYADLELGLADCAVVALAQRLDTKRIVSFDERHFRAVTPLQGGAFEILPADN